MCVSKITRSIIIFFKEACELPSVGCSSFASHWFTHNSNLIYKVFVRATPLSVGSWRLANVPSVCWQSTTVTCMVSFGDSKHEPVKPL
jgi:hypothetical protein